MCACLFKRRQFNTLRLEFSFLKVSSSDSSVFTFDSKFYIHRDTAGSIVSIVDLSCSILDLGTRLLSFRSMFVGLL